jgi:predicted dehydrogenase
MRVAVIGLGKMGLLHAGILNVMDGVEIVALCDRSFLVRRFLKKVLKRAVVTSDIEKLSGLDVDAVFVTTPIPSHFSVVKKIFDLNIASNIFVEKTLAASSEEAEKLCRLVNGRGVNMVGYMRRFAVTFKKAKELLTRGVLGDLISFKAYAYSSDFLGNPDGAGEQVSALRGGVLSDLGCHAIDVALWFFDEFLVDSAEVSSASSARSDEHVMFRVSNSNGFNGEFDVSWCMDGYRTPEVCFLIIGCKGIMKVNDDIVELKLKSGESRSWFRHDLGDNVSFWLGGPEYYREDEFFIKAVSEGVNAEPSFTMAAKVDRVIDEVKRRVNFCER